MAVFESSDSRASYVLIWLLPFLMAIGRASVLPGSYGTKTSLSEVRAGIALALSS